MSLVLKPPGIYISNIPDECKGRSTFFYTGSQPYTNSPPSTGIISNYRDPSCNITEYQLMIPKCSTSTPEKCLSPDFQIPKLESYLYSIPVMGEIIPEMFLSPNISIPRNLVFYSGAANDFLPANIFDSSSTKSFYFKKVENIQNEISNGQNYIISQGTALSQDCSVVEAEMLTGYQSSYFNVSTALKNIYPLLGISFDSYDPLQMKLIYSLYAYTDMGGRSYPSLYITSGIESISPTLNEKKCIQITPNLYQAIDSNYESELLSSISNSFGQKILGPGSNITLLMSHQKQPILNTSTQTSRLTDPLVNRYLFSKSFLVHCCCCSF